MQLRNKTDKKSPQNILSANLSLTESVWDGSNLRFTHPDERRKWIQKGRGGGGVQGLRVEVEGPPHLKDHRDYNVTGCALGACSSTLTSPLPPTPVPFIIIKAKRGDMGTPQFLLEIVGNASVTPR